MHCQNCHNTLGVNATRCTICGAQRPHAINLRKFNAKIENNDLLAQWLGRARDLKNKVHN